MLRLVYVCGFVLKSACKRPRALRDFEAGRVVVEGLRSVAQEALVPAQGGIVDLARVASGTRRDADPVGDADGHNVARVSRLWTDCVVLKVGNGYLHSVVLAHFSPTC